MKLALFFIFIAHNAIATAVSLEQKEGVAIITCVNSPNEPLRNQQTYKHVRIVELEKVPFMARINNVQKLEMNNECIFIQTDNKLYTYSADGRLIAQISKEGKREGEYSELTTFYINNGKKEINIIDNSKKKIIHYNFLGNFITEEIFPDDPFKWCIQTTPTVDNQLFNHHAMSMNDTKAYSMFDLQTKKISGQYFSYQPITLDNYVQPFSWHPISPSGKDIDFIMPLCDTVYTYLAVSSSLQPKYIIENTDKMASKTSIRKHTPSYSDDLSILTKEGYFTGFNGIFETDTKVLLSYISQTAGYLLFDKVTLQGAYHSFDSKNKTTSFYPPVYTYKNEFVSCLKAGALRLGVAVKDKKLQKQIKNLRSDSTCLVFYEL